MYTSGDQRNRNTNKLSERPVSVFGNANKNNNENSLKMLNLMGENNNHPGHVAHGEKKVFEEQLWIMGKLLGTVKGTFYLENLPVM